MSELYDWVADITSESDGSVDSNPPVPLAEAAFMQIPEDVFVNICEWLSVRDILALRMSNKCIARGTHNPRIWISLLRKLKLPLPILPATSKYRFGEIGPLTYEWLMVRGLYLEQNWRRVKPVATHSQFEGFDRTIALKMLPGGKYMVSVSQSHQFRYSLVLWDLDHRGQRVALAITVSDRPFMNLEVKFGMAQNLQNILIAYSQPPLDEAAGSHTKVYVLKMLILAIEELVLHGPDSALLTSLAEDMGYPFSSYHESTTSGAVSQLALGDFDGEMVLAVVYRPRALVFHYLESGKKATMALGPVYDLPGIPNSIWSVKLIASQNAILVARLLVNAHNGVVNQYNMSFVLELYPVPGPDEEYDAPACLSQQFLPGLHIDGLFFSDLETSWFTSLRDPEGLLPAPGHAEPPPISIFVTTRGPTGLVQYLMKPRQTGELVELPFRRGQIKRFAYELPAVKSERDKWPDGYARPMIIPGAYRSLVLMRPRIHRHLQKAGSPAIAEHGMEILQICTQTTHGGYKRSATPRDTGIGYSQRPAVPDPNAMDVEVKVVEQPQARTSPKLKFPVIPRSIDQAMRSGTTAFAFDESVGRLCVATTADTGIHVLDFGGMGCELAVVHT